MKKFIVIILLMFILTTLSSCKNEEFKFNLNENNISQIELNYKNNKGSTDELIINSENNYFKNLILSLSKINFLNITYKINEEAYDESLTIIITFHNTNEFTYYYVYSINYETYLKDSNNNLYFTYNDIIRNIYGIYKYMIEGDTNG